MEILNEELQSATKFDNNIYSGFKSKAIKLDLSFLTAIIFYEKIVGVPLSI